MVGHAVRSRRKWAGSNKSTSFVVITPQAGNAITSSAHEEVKPMVVAAVVLTFWLRSAKVTRSIKNSASFTMRLSVLPPHERIA